MNSKNSLNVQDNFFEDLKNKRRVIEVFLINGLILKCKILKIDNFSLLIEINNKKSLIYKHSIAYIK
tara:strand:+ start:293 stop:493 length:201 start_codon:yes stop_codon:yes gene_type:complete